MPIYVYENLDTGKTVELIKPVDERDRVPPHLKRVTVPRRVLVCSGNAVDPKAADGTVPKAFRELEQGGMSASEIAKQSGFSVDRIKQIWRM